MIIIYFIIAGSVLGTLVLLIHIFESRRKIFKLKKRKSSATLKGKLEEITNEIEDRADVMEDNGTDITAEISKLNPQQNGVDDTSTNKK